jgi:6-pyruvoyltetrahydropterin/6-carboxytetrahydropterin synthase
MYRVTREIAFCYGHRLHKYDGKCSQLHGHNGRAVIVLESPNLDARGMLVEFGEIKHKIERWIDSNLDHNLLLSKDDPLVATLSNCGERVFTMDASPTAENIARLIFDKAKETGLPVIEVILWETDKCNASYSI